MFLSSRGKTNTQLSKKANGLYLLAFYFSLVSNGLNILVLANRRSYLYLERHTKKAG